MNRDPLPTEAPELAVSHVTPFNTTRCMELLFHKARKELSIADLKALAYGGEDARRLALRGAQLTESLGCMVGAAGYASGASDGGFHQRDELAPLLLCLSDLFIHIEALTSVVNAAGCELEIRGYQ